jgi:hypothetical protein
MKSCVKLVEKYLNLIEQENMKRSFTTAEAKKIGDEIGVDWSKIKLEQFRRGCDVELEHGKVDQQTNITNDDPIKTGKIALVHLKEKSDYYVLLKKYIES